MLGDAKELHSLRWREEAPCCPDADHLSAIELIDEQARCIPSIWDNILGVEPYTLCITLCVGANQSSQWSTPTANLCGAQEDAEGANRQSSAPESKSCRQSL
jgi:transposase